MSQPTTTTGHIQLSHRQVLVVFSGLMLGMLLASLDQTIVSTALPTIVGELGGLQHLSWIITAYLLTSTASMPLYGKLSDLFGRKMLFQFGIVVFLIGSALSGVAQSMVELIGSRAIQGLGAGGIITMSQATIGDIIAPRDRGRYQGYMGTVFALSSVAGPLIGGLFTDHLTWRWVFYINLPLGFVALVVTQSVLRLPFERRKHPIDYLGSALMVAGLSALLLVTTWGGIEYPWLSTQIIGLSVIGVALLALFVFQEMRAPEPLLPLRLFREQVFRVGAVIMFVLGLAMFGTVAFLPLYLQVVDGVSATISGLRMLPMMAGVVTTSILAGQIISKTGKYRFFPIAGTAITTAGLFLLSQLNADSGFLEQAAFMLLLGVGLGMIMQVIILAVQNAVPYRDLGAATAGQNLFRSMGAAFGVAVFGSILNNRLDYYLPRLVPGSAIGGISQSALTAAPAQLRTLPLPVLNGVIDAFARSLSTVFLWAVPIAVIAFLASWLMHEIPLREHAHVGAEGENGTPSIPIVGPVQEQADFDLPM